jgi:hypothetical protein
MLFSQQINSAERKCRKGKERGRNGFMKTVFCSHRKLKVQREKKPIGSIRERIKGIGVNFSKRAERKKTNRNY